MIVFEDQLARLIEVLPDLTVGEQTATIKYNWGTEEVLTKYLALKKKLSFPLIWLVENEDINDLREPSVKRNARMRIPKSIAMIMPIHEPFTKNLKRSFKATMFPWKKRLKNRLP